MVRLAQNAPRGKGCLHRVLGARSLLPHRRRAPEPTALTPMRTFVRGHAGTDCASFRFLSGFAALGHGEEGESRGQHKNRAQKIGAGVGLAQPVRPKEDRNARTCREVY